jgi:hypothetical protein
MSRKYSTTTLSYEVHLMAIGGRGLNAAAECDQSSSLILDDVARGTPEVDINNKTTSHHRSFHQIVFQ